MASGKKIETSIIVSRKTQGRLYTVLARQFPNIEVVFVARCGDRCRVTIAGDSFLELNLYRMYVRQIEEIDEFRGEMDEYEHR